MEGTDSGAKPQKRPTKRASAAEVTTAKIDATATPAPRTARKKAAPAAATPARLAKKAPPPAKADAATGGNGVSTPAAKAPPARRGSAPKPPAPRRRGPVVAASVAEPPANEPSAAEPAATAPDVAAPALPGHRDVRGPADTEQADTRPPAAVEPAIAEPAVATAATDPAAAPPGAWEPTDAGPADTPLPSGTEPAVAPPAAVQPTVAAPVLAEAATPPAAGGRTVAPPRTVANPAAAEDWPVRRTPPTWVRVVTRPGTTVEQLAVAAVRELGPGARSWAERTRARYPGADADAVARLATWEYARAARRQGMTAAVGLVGALATTAAVARAQAELVLAIAAAYGRDPGGEDRVAELVTLLHAPTWTGSARTAVARTARLVAAVALRRVAAAIVPGGAAVVGGAQGARGVADVGARAISYYRFG